MERDGTEGFNLPVCRDWWDEVRAGRPCDACGRGSTKESGEPQNVRSLSESGVTRNPEEQSTAREVLCGVVRRLVPYCLLKCSEGRPASNARARLS
jgi:hypothetical protein